MNKEILKLKEKLDNMLTQMPIESPEVLKLSKEVDKLIIKYYRQ